MAQCRLPLLSRFSRLAAVGGIAPAVVAGVSAALNQWSEGGQEKVMYIVNSPRLRRNTCLLFVAVCLVQWQHTVQSAEGSRRGPSGGGAGGGRGRSGPSHSDRMQRGHTSSFLHYVFGSSAPSFPVITYALLVGAAAAAFFFLRRPSRSSLAAGGPASGGALRKDDARRIFRPSASICLNDILLKRKDGNKLCLEESAVQPFLSLCSWSRLFVFVQVLDDEEDHVMKELERIQAFDRGLLRHRVMFCSTKEGRASMVRQLQPLTHVDADSFISVTLDGKVPNVVCLREPLKECVDVLQAALQRR